MKRLTMFLAALLLTVLSAMAQTKVTGIVVSQEDNQPVVGVSVLVVGTNVGTVTGADGRFSLTVPQGKSQLRFTYVGMETLEVSARPQMRIVLRNGDTNLDEIVVTAMGISRQQKTLGYSAQTLKDDELTVGKLNDVTSALAGKRLVGAGHEPNSPLYHSFRVLSSVFCKKTFFIFFTKLLDNFLIICYNYNVNKERS